MAIAETKEGRVVGSTEEARERDLIDLLGARHPESKGLIDELSNLVGELMNQAEARGIERHGLQILQMIDGSRYQPDGCAAPDVETPGDDDRFFRVEVSA